MFAWIAATHSSASSSLVAAATNYMFQLIVGALVPKVVRSQQHNAQQAVYTKNNTTPNIDYNLDVFG